MDYMKVAKRILELVGGEENIESATHCATRLRMILKDENKVKQKELEKMDEVKGAFSSSGQFQIIIGQGAVNKVYEAMISGTNISRSSLSDAKKAAMKKMNPVQRFARMLSNIFVPIIPAIVASGLLMGLLGMSKTFGWVQGDSGLFKLLNMFSNAAFIFLPVLIAFSAAREFGANPFLAAVLGGILIHPDLQNAWTLGQGVKNTISVFGLNVGMIGYQGTVLPILIAVWVMGYIERGLRKVVPNVLDIILTPFLTLMLSGFVSLLVIGPAGRIIGDAISIGLQSFYNTAGAFAGIVFGGLYSSIVITGIHHSFHAIEAGLLANPSIGVNFLLPIWSMANVAQGGAALAVYFKTQNKKIKSIAPPAALSSLLGITEAAIFGVNLRLIRPFIAAAIGGALGGGYVVLTRVAMTAVGVTGIPGIAIVPQKSMLNYIIGIVIAFGGAFIVTLILGFKDDIEEELYEVKEDAAEETVSFNGEAEILLSPMKGKAVSLNEVPDQTFAEGIIGKGIAIIPEDGVVVSPVDGTVAHMFETKHAVAVVSDSGIEVLIHVGIDTVKMNGEGFKSFVNTGDRVNAGDKLLEVDLNLINERAKSTITPIIITNTDKCKNIKELKKDFVDFKDEIISVEF
ncbi:sucrose-specific PTS transporter subunit IIBC [Fonticella tunisiensis]|uniref:PTS system beta-glucosides-specific IIC component/PTS system sucrose-specific IIC component n=1 Tax=Fonticella tunisiensis TaxID=1096341 RepID=A0A4R7K4F2_9CLOT|nr:sucrose-specific PTS transporter subunit IIBC [Fonticella tunisiensis]TDT46065.1 PTS system beta-glucosides-specific IIC component/PTS system sucrose-specific IIC component [Fonticella tunisiensis]